MKITAVFLREHNGCYIYLVTCCCGELEIGVPRRSQKTIRHECGALFQQSLPKGMFGKPELQIVYQPK